MTKILSTFEVLDDYLSSDESPGGCLMLSDLDGFLTALACTPELVPDIQWMTAALGDPAAVPAEIIRLVHIRLAEIEHMLANGSLEPILWQDKDGHAIAVAWCEGFMEGLKLAPVSWKALSDTSDGAKLMLPILIHLFDDDGDSILGFPQEDLEEALDEAVEAMSSTVPAIYRQMKELASR